jgi:4-hydroxyphenylpyruvate dioxygenase
MHDALIAEPPVRTNPTFLNASMLGGSIAERVWAARDAGFDRLGLRPGDVEDCKGDGDALRGLVQEASLGVSDYQIIADFDGACDARRSRTRAEATAMLDSAVAVGAELVVVSASTNPDCIPSRIDNDMRWLAREAAHRQLRVAYEPTACSTFNSTLRSAWQCVRRVHEPNLGLALDVFHVFARGGDESDLDGVRTDRIFLVQLSDLAHGVPFQDICETANHHRLLPGQGRFPIRSILERLREVNYQGPIGLEVLNDELRARDPAAVAREAMAALSRVWVR